MSYSINISNAGIAECNGEYYLLNEMKTGLSRVWMLGDTYRLYYSNGWKLANGNITSIYYKLVTVTEGISDPIISNNGIGIIDPWITEDCMWVAIDVGNAPIPVVVEGADTNTLVETSTSEDADGNPVTTTKITNLNTGNVHTETSIIKNINTPTITEHDRYIAPSLTIGNVYQFEFVSDFSSLGYNPTPENVENVEPLKGIFKVEKLMTYLDMTISGINLYETLYKPLGLSTTLYNRDKEYFKNSVFYKLMDVTDETNSLYMPLTLIKGTPNNAVSRYNKLLISANLQTHDDPEMLLDMKDIIEVLLEARWGIKSTVKLAVYNKVWMPDAYYKTLADARVDNKKAYKLEYGNNGLMTRLFPIASNALINKNNVLMNKITAYEEIITNNNLGV